MDRKKELRDQYKTRKVTGGVYRFLNRENGRFALGWTADMQAIRNRFKMAQACDDCPMPSMAADWKQYGKAAFVLEELEQLDKSEEQEARDFQNDLKLLCELWSEKLPADGRY